MPPSTEPDPNQRGHHPADPRPHVAALLELAALGWHVTEIRPGRSAPVLWRVTIKRYDESVSITAMEADPDDALDELIRYATIDAEGSSAAAALGAGPAEP